MPSTGMAGAGAALPAVGAAHIHQVAVHQAEEAALGQRPEAQAVGVFTLLQVIMAAAVRLEAAQTDRPITAATGHQAALDMPGPAIIRTAGWL